MRSTLKALILIPLALLAVAFAVANRGDVPVSFDPLSADPQKYAVPLFLIHWTVPVLAPFIWVAGVLQTALFFAFDAFYEPYSGWPLEHYCVMGAAHAGGRYLVRVKPGAMKSVCVFTGSNGGARTDPNCAPALKTPPAFERVAGGNNPAMALIPPV